MCVQCACVREHLQVTLCGPYGLGDESCQVLCWLPLCVLDTISVHVLLSLNQKWQCVHQCPACAGVQGSNGAREAGTRLTAAGRVSRGKAAAVWCVNIGGQSPKILTGPKRRRSSPMCLLLLLICSSPPARFPSSMLPLILLSPLPLPTLDIAPLPLSSVRTI